MIVKITCACDYCGENGITIAVHQRTDFMVKLDGLVSTAGMYYTKDGYVACMRCRFQLKKSEYRGYL